MAEDLRSLALRFGLLLREDAQPVACAAPAPTEAPGLVADSALAGGAGPAPFSPDLLRALQASPISVRHDTATDLLGVRCGTWHRDPQVWLFEDVDGMLDALGAVAPLGPSAQHSRVVALDARGERPVGAALMIHGQPWLVRAARGGIELVGAARERAPLGLASPSPQRPPQLQAPSVAELVGEHPVQAWLLERAQALAASPSLLDRAAAAGLLGRLADAEVTAPQAALARRLGGDPGPAARVRAWAATLEGAVVEELERCLLLELGALGDELETFASGPAAGEAATGRESAALGLRLQRDDLESVAFVLRARLGAAEASALNDALFGVDRRGLAHLDALDCLDEATAPRQLRAVGWREHRAWWAVRP